MSIPRLFLLKQLFSTPKSQSLISPISKPYLNSPIFTLTTISNNTTADAHSEIINFVTRSPNSTVVPLLERFYGGNAEFPPNEDDVLNVVRKLRQRKCYDRALEVLEWMASKVKTQGYPKDGDLACKLSLIGHVHGVDTAEKFFKEVDIHSEKMYGALLNCYTEATLVDKAVSFFKKMKNLGLVMCNRPYNNIMTLYINTGQHEKVPELLLEMEEIGLYPNNLTYRICFKSFAIKSDFSSIEKLLKKGESERRLSINWSTYISAANYFLEGGFKEKAVYCLNQAEKIVRGDIVGFSYLITMYAKMGDFARVMNLWWKFRGTSKANTNATYKIMISSLVKLDQLEMAENFLQEWDSNCRFYDFRIVNVLLLGYTQKGLVEKAEELLQEIISRKLTPIPSTWTIIASGHISCHNMNKGLMFFKKALKMGSGLHDSKWVPNSEVLSSLLKWIGENGGIEEVDEFFELLSKVVPMNEEMYQTLVKAYIRHGKDIDDVLARMEGDNIEVNEESLKIIASSTGS